MSVLDALMSKAYNGGKVAGLISACAFIDAFLDGLNKIGIADETREALVQCRAGLSLAANMIETENGLPPQ